MLQVDRIIRLTVLLLVVVSGGLLGLSLGSFRLTMIACGGAFLGFLLADQFKCFHVDGLLANIASVTILVLAMKDFWPEDSTGKLISVANLLVYLQTVLMLQKKTPRLIWQILVLSLLQVVVAAIFSLNFEGGMLFLFYFFVAGVTMVLQAVYSGNYETLRRNRAAALRLGGAVGSSSAVNFAFDSAGTIGETHASADSKRTAREAETQTLSSLSGSGEAVLLFDVLPRDSRPLQKMMWHVSMWMLLGLLFTSILFYMIPRHAKPWFGPDRTKVATAPFSKSVDLQNENKIYQSSELMFRATFEKAGSRDNNTAVLSQPPYFRGMALSSLVIEDGKTNWRAPHDRIHMDVYQDFPRFPGGASLVKQSITLSETIDPLIHTAMPAFRISGTPESLEFCHEVSALTRCRIDQKIDLAPFKYELGTLIDELGRMCEAWPYVANAPGNRQKPMSDNLPQFRWLTSIDKARYPRLVSIADGLVKRVRGRDPSISQYDLIKEFEQYFLAPERFEYTLDFSDFDWDESLDPVEDFIRNHRSGHCELFASALVLMLRSQDIPARLVVGYHGGDFNGLSNSYMVRGKHAHAWVEAYLAPEDCSKKMRERGEAGTGGAWLVVDPTPPSNEDVDDVATEAIDLARNIWQDYVLGMDAPPTGPRSSPLAAPFYQFLKMAGVEQWSDAMDDINRGRSSAFVRYLLVALVLLPLMIALVVSYFRPSRKPKTSGKRSSRIRGVFADVVSWISPSLGQWVRESTAKAEKPTVFYDRLTGILEPCGLLRKPSQTHREFATEVSHSFARHPDASLIDSTVREVTELFNEVRFGGQTLPEDLTEQIDVSLSELENSVRLESLQNETLESNSEG